MSQSPIKSKRDQEGMEHYVIKQEMGKDNNEFIVFNLLESYVGSHSQDQVDFLGAKKVLKTSFEAPKEKRKKIIAYFQFKQPIPTFKIESNSERRHPIV